jgi:hypothetical protein
MGLSKSAFMPPFKYRVLAGCYSEISGTFIDFGPKKCYNFQAVLEDILHCHRKRVIHLPGSASLCD